VFPVKPVNPAEPVAPVDPTGPVKPVDPVPPVPPVKPTGPWSPLTPVAPVYPVYPVKPVDPEGPSLLDTTTTRILSLEPIIPNDAIKPIISISRILERIMEKLSISIKAFNEIEISPSYLWHQFFHLVQALRWRLYSLGHRLVLDFL
jgi:hypothetical protein